ncbi:MAG TPA: D-glycerate dehydrogenase [Chloroflexia bacterium]|nr:D-glycerate dehydrogenase [Chloroflexia bacterium]
MSSNDPNQGGPRAAWPAGRRPRVLVTQAVPQVALDLLQTFADVDANPDEGVIWSPDELRAHLPGHDGLYCLLTDTIDAAVMDALPELRVIANMAVGFNNVDVEEATRRGIAVTNTPGVLTDTTADFAWALLMAAARRVAEADRFTRAGKFHGWGPLMLLGGDVAGRTLGVVGFGRIGQALARRARGFAMPVLYYDLHPVDTALEQELHATFSSLDDLLAQADFVSLHVNYTPETHHLLSHAQFARMKRTAYVINTARGPVIDEAALAEALRTQQIAGAGLDVYEQEPAVHPGLLALENVVLAPHIASATIDTRNAMATMAAQNIQAVFANRRPPNLVNPAVWPAG